MRESLDRIALMLGALLFRCETSPRAALHRVSDRVNKPSEGGAELIEAVDAWSSAHRQRRHGVSQHGNTCIVGVPHLGDLHHSYRCAA